MPHPSSAPVEPQASAREAGLRYVTDVGPGWTRRAEGEGFVYLDERGRRLKTNHELERIRRLAIPPAWKEVWISPVENGHLQATGKDARGRKQYRYHPSWRAVRDENKYERVLAFGRALPRLRRRVRRDLRRPGLPREKILATVVKLLEVTLIRVGNEEYARENHSYGLTTMRNRHARVRGAEVTFSFKGKSGKRHEIGVRDAHLAKVVKRCRDLPGQELFEYEDEAGQRHGVSSQDVNEYLREAMGGSFTAKDFRTWSGTVLAAIALREFSEFTSQQEARSHIVQAIESVAKMLGNTPTICRRCYVHPQILEGYLQGATIETLQQRGGKKLRRELRALRPEEAAVMVLLQERLRRAAGKGPTKAADLAKALSAGGGPAHPRRRQRKR